MQNCIESQSRQRTKYTITCISISEFVRPTSTFSNQLTSVPVPNNKSIRGNRTKVLGIMKKTDIWKILGRLVQGIEVLGFILVTVNAIIVYTNISTSINSSVANSTEPLPNSESFGQQLFSFFVDLFSCFWLFWLATVGILVFGICKNCPKLLLIWILFNTILKLQILYFAVKYLCKYRDDWDGAVDYIIGGFICYILAAFSIVFYSTMLICKEKAQVSHGIDSEKASSTNL